MTILVSDLKLHKSILSLKDFYFAERSSAIMKMKFENPKLQFSWHGKQQKEIPNESSRFEATVLVSAVTCFIK